MIIIPDHLPYTPRGIECLRFGARRGGEGIGCCAVDVIQGFSNAPDAMRPPVPFFNGDSWTPVLYGDTQLHLAGTNEDVFLSYLAHGSFTEDPVTDHAFIAVISEEQCHDETGRQWLRILHREGFQWAASVSNGVYAEYHPNHIFIMARATNEHMDEDEIESLKSPPAFWQGLGTPGNPAERYATLLQVYAKTHQGSPEGEADSVPCFLPA